MHKIYFFGLCFLMSTIAYTMKDDCSIESLNSMAEELKISPEQLSLILKRAHKNLDEMLEERRFINTQPEVGTKTIADINEQTLSTLFNALNINAQRDINTQPEIPTETIADINALTLFTLFNALNINVQPYIKPNNIKITSKPSNDEAYPTLFELTASFQLAPNTSVADAFKILGHAAQNVDLTKLNQVKIKEAFSLISTSFK